MVDYFEFPFDQLRSILVPKKPPDGGGGPGPDDTNPCGAWISPDSSGGYPGGIWSVQDIGLYQYLPGKLSGGTIVMYDPARHIVDGHFSSTTDYLWRGIEGVTVTATSAQPCKINVWRNYNPQTFNPCNDGVSDSGNPVFIAPMTAPEEYPPFFMVVGDPGLSQCDQVGAHLEVQGHCDIQTDDDLPPQPEPYPMPAVVTIIGPALPGCIFYRWYG
jgi:hypothetical protein